MYIGDKYQCNICHYHLRSFVHSDHEKLCPSCGSISRDRRLWQLLDAEFLKDNQHVLDFSPSRSIYREMKKRAVVYVSTDLSGDFISEHRYDITDTAAKDESFDLIICYHILEHIDDDTKAMNELLRMLKSNGYCIIQTPFKEGGIYENKMITTSQQRTEHFGQSDHVRIYSVDGLKSRLESVGFTVEVRNYDETDQNYNGFKKNETILLCKKHNIYSIED